MPIKKKVKVEFEVELYNSRDDEAQVMHDFEYDLACLKRDLTSYFAGQVRKSVIALEDVTDNVSVAPVEKLLVRFPQKTRKPRAS